MSRPSSFISYPHYLEHFIASMNSPKPHTRECFSTKSAFDGFMHGSLPLSLARRPRGSPGLEGPVPQDIIQPILHGTSAYGCRRPAGRDIGLSNRLEDLHSVYGARGKATGWSGQTRTHQAGQTADLAPCTNVASQAYPECVPAGLSGQIGGRTNLRAATKDAFWASHSCPQPRSQNTR